MSSFSRFEEIGAWSKARVLVRGIYSVTGSSQFKRDFALVNQIRRASLSIKLNIAEGFARRTDKEFRRFLLIANGSAAEVQSAPYVALDQHYINQSEFQHLYDACSEIRRMIDGLRRYLHRADVGHLRDC